jgi:hypothetical protein
MLFGSFGLVVVFEFGFVFMPGVPEELVPLPIVPEFPELVVPEPEVVPELLLPVAPPLPALAGPTYPKRAPNFCTVANRTGP